MLGDPSRKHGRIGLATDEVLHRHATRRLLQRKTTLIRQEEGELLLVVRTPPRLRGRLHEHDADLLRR